MSSTLSKRSKQLFCHYRTSAFSLTLLASFAAAAYGMGSTAVPVQGATHRYSIASGALADTLREISRISGRAIRFEGSDVQGRVAPALSGDLNTLGAVQAAISESGLTMTTSANGDIVVFVPELETVTVTATRDEAEKGFMASSSDTATRSGSNLLDVPQAVTIVTAKVIETQQAQSVQDVLQNVAGVITSRNAQGVAGYSIRGYTNPSPLSNGVANPSGTMVGIASVERIEVLKGPQSILSGADSLGGVINIVTKKPTAERVFDVSTQWGSRSSFLGSVDSAGALTDDKKLSYRVIASGLATGTNEASFKGQSNQSIVAQIRWKDGSTDFNVGASYDNNRSAPNLYTLALSGNVQQIPTMRMGNPSDGIEMSTKALFYSLEHEFSPWLTLVSRFQRSIADRDTTLYAPAFPISVEDMILGMTMTTDDWTIRTTSGDHYLRFKFDTGPIAHKLSAGMNHTSNRDNAIAYQQMFNGNFNIEVPIYQSSQFDFPPALRDSSTLSTLYGAAQEQQAVFIQDLMTIGKWHASVGVRRHRYVSGPASMEFVQEGFTSSYPKNKTYQTTPNAGVIYNVTPNVSLYASYAEGFLPQFVSELNCAGGIGGYPPMETKNKELGIKGVSRGGDFSWSGAAYQMDQQNMLQFNDAGQCYDVRAARRQRGFETEAAGRLTAGLNLTFNYTFSDVEDVNDPNYVAGSEPRHQGSVWSTYDFQSPRLQGLQAALGVSAFSKTQLGVTTADPQAPGGARVDASAAYFRDSWSLRLGVKNLFDRQLYGFSSTVLYVPVLEGRTFALTWQKSFF